MTTSSIGVSGNGDWMLLREATISISGQRALQTKLFRGFLKSCPPMTVHGNNTTGLLAIFSKSTRKFLVQLKIQTSL